MKKVLFIIIIGIVFSFNAFSQNGQPIFTLNNGDISPNGNFINSFESDNYTGITPYNLRKNTVVSCSNGDQFIVRLYKYNGWNNEPGDYNVIEVTKNNQTLLEITNPLAWNRFTTEANSTPVDFVAVNLSNDAVALIFDEYIYASQPSNVTIIVVYNNKAKVVFNKPFFINSYSQSSTAFSMELQKNTLEYVYGKSSTNSPILDEIWLENGILRFKEK